MRVVRLSTLLSRYVTIDQILNRLDLPGLRSSVERQRVLHLNFEDERLLDFSVKDFQYILDVYYGRFPENKAESG